MQTFSGKEYLKIDITSNFGLDKKTWNERIDWFNARERVLEHLVQEAKEPALYYAGVKAYRDVEKGLPIGYMISLDATSSGLQILAALTGDRSAAELCNVVDTGHREDAYTSIYNRMLSLTGGQSKITREMTKQAIMTSLYGSTAVPKQVFGEGALLDVFFKIMETHAPAAWELNKAFLSIWNPEAYSHDWVLPDNFYVHVKVMNTTKELVNFYEEPFQVIQKVNQPVEGGRSLGANTIHSIDGMIVRELTRRCDYNPETISKIRFLLDHRESWNNRTLTQDDNLVVTLWDHYQKSGYLSARILNHLNAQNFGHVDPSAIEEMILELPEKPFKVVSVHDCFRCLPHYGNDLRKQYNLQLAHIAKSNLLSFLLAQIMNRSVQIQKMDPGLWQSIRQTNYALS